MPHQAGDQFLFALTGDVVEITWIEIRWNAYRQPVPFYHLETLPVISQLGKKQKKHRYTMSDHSLSRFFTKIPVTAHINTDMFLPIEEDNEPF